MHGVYQTSPKKRNPQQQKKSRNATKKTAQLCGKTTQLATLVRNVVALAPQPEPASGQECSA